MELYELTAHELAELKKKKEINSRDVAESLFKRINQVNPKINIFNDYDESKVLKEIDKVESEDRNKSYLSGIPFGIKDNMCTMGYKTTCSSKILENFESPYNATVIENLKQNGNPVLGKLNMDEFAMGGSNENSYFGDTKNPWDLSRVTGGSSGGSAASIASDCSIISLGSDTGGSIRQPAAFCGVVGLKPTYGLVSRYGLVAFASSLDQIGPLTKDVTDAALALNIISGYDEKDSTSLKTKKQDYTKALINDVKGIKIGVPKEYLSEGVNEEVKKAIFSALDVLEKLGASWEEISIPLTEYAIPAYYIISSAEASSNLARYDGVKYGYRTKNYSDLLDLYKKSRSEGFGKEVKRRIMLGTYALSSGYYDAYYNKALKVRTLIKRDFDNALDKYDVILGPTTPTTAYKLGAKIDNPLEMYLGDIYTVSANIAGLPGINIPCGFDKDNMPIGMQLISKPLAENKILRVAYTFEQNTLFHIKKPNLGETKK
ncbi:MAG: Asp-tRNA(Asn)/Glu-tRNA(Gln) amidotransferase subunit GatA [Clostridiales bacterium]